MSSSRDHWSTHWDAGHNWALVLAAGDGTRLQSLTTLASGIAVPKQFCSVGGGASLLHAALERAQVIAPPQRSCVVVAGHHHRWWQSLPHSVSEQNIIVQPCNRGTANGILLPLLQILHRDSEASLLVLPSDHYVRNEALLATSLRQAMTQVERRHDRITLLGFEPDEADCELGYIVPSDGAAASVRDVSRFVEKPGTAVARHLIEQGGLWNSFIFAAHGQTLLRAFEARAPQIVSDMRRIITSTGDEATRRRALLELYDNLPVMDFSRDVLEQSILRLQVLPVPACGWSDLGTPRRVAEVIETLRPAKIAARAAGAHTTGFLDLAVTQPLPG